MLHPLATRMATSKQSNNCKIISSFFDGCPDNHVVKDEQAVGGLKYKWGKNRKTYDAAIKEKADAETPDNEATDHTERKVYVDTWIVIFYDEETIPTR